MDILGNVYVMLAKAKLNSYMIEFFFRNLASRLDEQRPQLRTDIVIIVDGANYNQWKVFLPIASELRFPYMLFRPHSYDGAPWKLVFAHFKKADINPSHVPTAKR